MDKEKICAKVVQSFTAAGNKNARIVKKIKIFKGSQLLGIVIILFSFKNKTRDIRGFC
jgi:hypothetical protein